MSITKELKEEIFDYIKKPLPSCMNVVEQSVPVPFFGNIEKARVATLSINPSLGEFLDDSNRLLQYKRFCDRETLGVSDMGTLTPEQTQIVYDSLMNYFHVNPYTDWFKHLEKFVNGIFADKSYFDDTMVHLDICQWATDPVWGDLTDRERSVLLKDYDLFAKIVLDPSCPLDYVYVNGKTAQENFEKVCKIDFHKIKLVSSKKWYVFYKVLDNGCVVIGTNANVPRSPVSRETIQEIKDICRIILSNTR